MAETTNKTDEGFVRKLARNEVLQWVGEFIIAGRVFGGGNREEGKSFFDEINEHLPGFSPEEKEHWNTLWASLSPVEQDQIEDFLDEAARRGWDKLFFEHQCMLDWKHARERDKKLLVANSSIHKTLVLIASHSGNYEYQQRKALQNKLLLRLEGIRWAAQNKSAFAGYIALILGLIGLGIFVLFRYGTF